MIRNSPANIPQETKSDLWHKQLCIKGISNIALISFKQLNSDAKIIIIKKKNLTEKPGWQEQDEGMWGPLKSNTGRLFRKSL